MDAGDLLLAEAGIRQSLRALGVIAPGAQRADVEAVRAHGELQGLVVDMADVGQRHDRRVGVETDLRDRVLRPFGVEADAGEARRRRERRARIDHHHLVAGDLHELGQHLADVRGADDEHARRRHHGMQEHLAVGRRLQLALAAVEALRGSPGRRPCRRGRTSRGGRRSAACARPARGGCGHRARAR